MTGENRTKQKIAAITGGTGFLGRYIIADLIAAGWTVRMLVRSEPLHPLHPALDAEIVLGDLSDQSTLDRLCTGADAIIHAAGLIKAKSREAFFAVNETGSANLARAAVKVAPEARIVVVSSMAARAPQLSDYAASKQAGEAAIRATATGPVTILRPSAIYGPWDKETFPLFQMAAKGIVLGPMAETARICLVNAADVSNSVVTFAAAGDAEATYEITDACTPGYAWAEIVASAGKALETRPCLANIPPRLFKTGAFCAEIVARGAGKTPILTRGKVREILHGDWGSAPALQPPPDIWCPQVKLADGFAQTAQWYRDQKWL